MNWNDIDESRHNLLYDAKKSEHLPGGTEKEQKHL
jgi:hypothetical protein